MRYAIDEGKLSHYNRCQYPLALRFHPLEECVSFQLKMSLRISYNVLRIWEGLRNTLYVIRTFFQLI